MKLRFFLALTIMALFLGACSLAGDVTPPPGYVRPTAAPTAVSERPQNFDLAAGQAVYETKCAACHGERGLGDGPQAAQLGVPVTALGDPAVAGQASLEAWYQVVTEGRMDAMMPPFASLTDEERWNVVYYAMTLHAQRPEATATPAETAAEATAEATPIVSAEEVTAAPSATPEASGEGTATPAAETLTITGSVFNGSGGEAPADLTVTLEAYDPDESGQFNLVYSDETRLAADHTFTFENVPTAVHRALLARTTYAGVEYTSEPLFLVADQEIVPLDITVYDTTTDTSALMTERWHFFVDFTAADAVDVVEVYVVDNTGLETVVPLEDGTPVVTFTLPENAQNLRFSDGVLGDRFVLTENGFGDLQPVPGGGQQQVVFTYSLPYDGKLDLSRSVTMDTDAMVVLVPEGVQVESDLLASNGAQTFQDQTLNVYSSQPIPAGGTITLHIKGEPKSAAAPDSGGTNNLLIGIGGLGLALIIVGLWMFYRDRHTVEIEVDDEFGSAEEVMDAIIALDEQYQAGKIKKEAYQSRRAELKDLLKDMME